MSDRFYDNKGIEHIGVFAERDAENANRRYLREEEEARERGLKLQRQQLEAAERVSRDAEWHRRQQEEAQKKQFSELKRQGQAARKDGDYQNKVLFLKESDEATRLETFVGTLVSTLDWECCPKNARGDCDDGGWVAEHKRILSLFYQLPGLPKECQADGTLTKSILALVNTTPESADAFQPDGETKTLKTNRSLLGWFRVAGALLLALGIVAFVYDKTIATEPALAVDYCILAIGLLLCAIPSALRPLLRPQFKAKQKKKETLEKDKSEIAQKEALQRRLQHLPDETRMQAGKQVTAETCTQQWITVYCTTLIRSFFDRGLWIEDQFPNRLKAVLQEIQSPFPTSCRADVNKLGRVQIESAYKVLAATVADLMAPELSRTDCWPGGLYPLVQSLLSSSKAGTASPKPLVLSGKKSMRHWSRVRRPATATHPTFQIGFLAWSPMPETAVALGQYQRTAAGTRYSPAGDIQPGR